MAVIRKVQSRVSLPPKQEKSVVSASKEAEGGKSDNGFKKDMPRTKKFCNFCKHKSEPIFWDALSLRRFVNDRGRIVARARTGTCAKHQRRVSREIKRARLLALLPFAPRA